MANAIVGSPVEVYNPAVHDLPAEELFGKAQAGDLDACAVEADRPLVVVQAGTDTAAAITLASLIALGVTFPAGFYRTVQADIYTRNSANSESAWKQLKALVVGGAPPTIPAPAALVHNSGSTALDTELVATIDINASDVTVRLTTVPAAQFNHRCEVRIGPLMQINNVDT